MSDQSITIPAIFALDNDEAGEGGTDGRPPPNVDGTPHEVLEDQAVRLRQVMSILESQFSGETILLVFPDGTSPALLSAMIAGIPYNRCHELEYSPGEVRLDVTRDSALALWKNQQSSRGTYETILTKGRENLRMLRDEPDAAETMNLKDQKIEEERLAVEKVMAEKYQVQALAEERKQAAREERRGQIQQEARERAVQRNTGTPVTVPSAALVAGGAATIVGLAAVLSSAPESKQSASKQQRGEIPAKTSSGSLNVHGDSAPAVATSVVAEINAVTAEYVASDIKIDAKASNGTQTSSQPKTQVAEAQGITEQPIDKEEIAAKAMKEYLEKDDGGDDWLQSLSEIISEGGNDDTSSDTDSGDGGDSD